ncbi:GGDEF domain-containing protein [Sphingorhabdus sp.]|uniref:GGDEF domain-containing protein n=1 Tax=Sphingorhabdus sp. TaxID=1902408 RepID=UPI0039835157
MKPGIKVERRKAKTRAFRFRQPFFMQIPKTLAASLLAGCALIAMFASHAIPNVAFGPFFLLICAFGAWFVGNQFAVLLGLFIASIQILNGHALYLQDGPVVSAMKFCSVVAVVLMLGVARAALEIEWRFARVDPLTGALNRKAFFEAVAREAGQTGMTVLVYADIDGLKRLNDRHGHEAGDKALRDFADGVRNTVRKDDVFARIGGDEFVIFLRVHDTAAAELVAQRLHRVLNLDFDAGGAKLKCSLGVLVLPAGSRSIDAELKQADTLMYHAKRDRTGLMMATSVKGDMQELMPYAPTDNAAGQQRSSVRIAPRSTVAATSDLRSKNSIAA